jgi:quercetin dioxygenase-like cupin family protein
MKAHDRNQRRRETEDTFNWVGEKSPNGFTRRQFLLNTTAALAGSTLITTACSARASSDRPQPATPLVPPGTYGRYDALGPLVEFFTPDGRRADYSVMQGTLPPRGVVPLHSHPDDESFFLIGGTLQALVEHRGSFEWFDVPLLGFVHVPKNAKHAWRNVGDEPVVQLIVTSTRLGQFFRDACRPLGEDEPTRPPMPEDLARFTQVAKTYGHWLASPQENAAVGILM